MKKLFILFGLVLVLASTANAAIGKIVAARGDVLVTREGKLLPAKTGFNLEKKDIITTQAKAKAQILFEDQTVITIGKSSVFKIEEYIYDEKKPELAFNISKGAFRAITGKIGKIAPDRFKLKTKTATIGIRGTQILGDVGQKPEAPVKIAFTQGHGYVQTPQGTVDIKAGQITNVTPGKAPTPPRAYKPAEINQMGSASGGGGEKMESDEVIDDSPEAVEAEEDALPAESDEEVALEEEFDATPEVEAEEVDVGEIFNVPEVDIDVLVEQVQEITDVIQESEDVADVIAVADELLSVDIDDPSANIPGFVEHLNDQKVVIDADPYMSWGAWIESDADPVSYTASEVLEYWASGDLTPKSKIDEYIQDASGATYNYTGSVHGVIDNGSALERASGSMNLTFDFHNSDISGTLGMASTAGTSMSLAVDTATIVNDGFTIDSFAASSTVAGESLVSGSASGNFYGASDADAVGGTFNVTGENNTAAYGVFAGTK